MGAEPVPKEYLRAMLQFGALEDGGSKLVAGDREKGNIKRVGFGLAGEAERLVKGGDYM